MSKGDYAAVAVQKEGHASKELQPLPRPVNEKGEEISFEDGASVLDHWTMRFMNHLFIKGYSEQGINHADLGVVSQQDKASNLFEKFDAEWKVEMKKPVKKRGLWKTLFRTMGIGKVFYALFLYLIFSAMQFLPILVLNWLMKYLEGKSDMSVTEQWLCVGTMLLVPIFSSLLAVQSNAIFAHMGIDIRNALTIAIYRKSMTLSPSARQKVSTGGILNMFSSDTRMISQFLFFMNNVCMAPLQISVSLYLIYSQVQVATFAGLGVMLVMMPLNGFFFKFLTQFRQLKLKVTDRRVKLMNEVLAGIRIIKYYAWELPFSEQVTAIRSEELVYLKKIAYLVAGGFTLILMALPIVLPVVVFFTFIEIGNELTGTVAFTTIALFGIMQLPFAFLPMGLSTFANSLVACERIMSLLNEAKLDEYVTRESRILTNMSGEEQHMVVGMKNANVNWVKETPEVIAQQHEARADAMACRASIGHEAELRKVVQDGLTKEENELAIKDYVTTNKDEDPEEQDVGINRSCHTLMDMSFQIKKGDLVAVVGPVGSGKSSLLNALLGEMLMDSGGEVWLEGDVAYTSQQPWVMNETVRENVLFGRDYDEALFDEAVHAAALEDDIRILPGGIMTEIGEKGINLSGGQKARVSLARAVYRNADVYFMDDPLSAVDAHVGEHIFEECIVKQLKGKTRILVTHNVHVLPKCDKVIILDDGRIKAQGSFDELSKSGINLSEYVAAYVEETYTSDDVDGTEADAGATKSRSASSASASGDADKTKAGAAAAAAAAAADADADKTTVKEAKAEIRHADTRKSTLMSMEERKLGDVSGGTYMYYLRSGGWAYFAVGLMFQVLAECAKVGSSFWLSEWGSESVKDELQGKEMTNKTATNYLRVYATLSMGGLLFTFVRALLVAQHRIKTSAKLHHDLLSAVVQAPIWFFDSTPLGRIMNRFSSDMIVVDEELSQTINQVTNSLFGVGGAALGVIAATKGTFLILLIPLTFIYVNVQGYFRKTNTTVARLASVSLSPIYTEFSQALGGTASIRAYADMDRFNLSMESKVDCNTVAAVTQQLCGQWLAIRLDIIGAFISCFIAFLTIATKEEEFIPAGWMGLGLTYSFTITSFLKFGVKVLATGEAQMNAVERVMYYCEYMDNEETVVVGSDKQQPLTIMSTAAALREKAKAAAADANKEKKDGFIDDGYGNDARDGIDRAMRAVQAEQFNVALADSNKKYANWPSKGAIEFKNVHMSYHTGPPVLKDINIHVPGGSKIGVCGRTGSGKSSMMVALFRIEEIEAGGSIFIDGVDISTVPLSILRSRLGIIPQDPVMFSVTVRFNLDPFNRHTDAEVWEALDMCAMREHVQALPNGLSENVAEGGENFSAGQRQLLCIARALLRGVKILVLDEATASIDNETDALVQKMIRSSFKDCTVLTIAHRLHTIVDNDKILVLEQGNLAEFDDPDVLLDKSGDDALFRNLWDKHLAASTGNMTSSGGSSGDLSKAVDGNEKKE